MPITLSIGRRHDLANNAKVSPLHLGRGCLKQRVAELHNLVCDSGLEIGCYYEPNHEFLWARNVDEA